MLEDWKSGTLVASSLELIYIAVMAVSLVSSSEQVHVHTCNYTSWYVLMYPATHNLTQVRLVLYNTASNKNSGKSCRGGSLLFKLSYLFL